MGLIVRLHPNIVWRGLTPFALASMLLLAGCGGEPTSDWSRVDTPMEAPDVVLPRVDGRLLRLSDLRGQVVIMEFWASWCVPCRYSTPSLQMIHETYADQGAVVLLVNQGETLEQVQEWIDNFKLTGPVVLDPDGRAKRLYEVRGLPKLFVIDQAGQILYIKSGYGGGLERNLHAIVRELLANDA